MRHEICRGLPVGFANIVGDEGMIAGAYSAEQSVTSLLTFTSSDYEINYQKLVEPLLMSSPEKIVF